MDSQSRLILAEESIFARRLCEGHEHVLDICRIGLVKEVASYASE